MAQMTVLLAGKSDLAKCHHRDGVAADTHICVALTPDTIRLKRPVDMPLFTSEVTPSPATMDRCGARCVAEKRSRAIIVPRSRVAPKDVDFGPMAANIVAIQRILNQSGQYRPTAHRPKFVHSGPTAFLFLPCRPWKSWHECPRSGFRQRLHGCPAGLWPVACPRLHLLARTPPKGSEKKGSPSHKTWFGHTNGRRTVLAQSPPPASPNGTLACYQRPSGMHCC